MTMPLSELPAEYMLPYLRGVVGEWLKTAFSLRAVSDGPQCVTSQPPDTSIVWGRFSRLHTRLSQKGERRHTAEWSSDVPIAIIGQGDYAVNWYGHLLRWSPLEPRGVPVSAGEWIHTTTDELSPEQKTDAITQLTRYVHQRQDILLQE